MDKSENQIEMTAPPKTTWWSRNGLITLAIAAQLTTLVITLPTWQVRTTPVNLPLFDVPQIPYLWLIAIFASAIAPFWLRRSGSWIHLAVLVLACCWDQFRIQPQFFFCWAFIWAASDLQSDRKDGLGVVFCRWALITLWFWAGLHKLLSPEWLDYKSCDFLWRMGFGDAAPKLHLGFAIMVGASEIGLAILAFVRPRFAAWCSILLHAGIIAALLIAFWNYSVFPWNGMAALLGFRLFYDHKWKFSWREFGVSALLMISPALFYVGKVDRAFAIVLYSGMTPSGQITHANEAGPRLERINGWGELAVPFPSEQRTLLQYFELTSNPGSKLYIRDKRRLMDDRYFVKTASGANEISKARFYSGNATEIAGFAHEDPSTRFAMDLAKINRLKRTADAMVHAIELNPENYSRELLSKVAGYPNIEQIQLAGCPITDEDLKLLSGLYRLQGIGISQTNITAKGLRNLRDLPRLNLIQHDDTVLTKAEVLEFLRNKK